MAVPPQGEDYDTNGIFVLPLYGFLKLPDKRRCTTFKAVYTNYQVPSQPIQLVYDSENTHGSTFPKIRIAAQHPKGSNVTQMALFHT